MREEDIKRELAVVSDFVKGYLSSRGLGDHEYARGLLTRANEMFVEHVGARPEWEACATELVLFSRSLEAITVENKELQKIGDDYYRDFTASVAALQRVAAAVRLRFLLQDLQTIVNDQ
jgi:hypothetical protein